MKKKYKYIVLLLFILLIINGCTSKTKQKIVVNTQLEASNKIEDKQICLDIITTDKFLYNMVKDISKDNHNVDYMFKNKNELWNFKFSDDSLSNIGRQDLFIYVGAGYEPWLGGFLDKLSKNKVGIINASRGVKLSSYSSEVKYKDTVIKDNPYYWMNIDNYKIALLNIKNAIQERDPQNRDVYEENFNQTIKELDAIQKRLRDISDKAKDITFVVDGDELDYFTKYLNLKVIKMCPIINSNSQTDNKDEKDKIEKRIKESKNLIFLYEDEAKLKDDTDFINKYSMKPVNLFVNNGKLKYIEMLNYNLDALEKSIGK